MSFDINSLSQLVKKRGKTRSAFIFFSPTYSGGRPFLWTDSFLNIIVTICARTDYFFFFSSLSYFFFYFSTPFSSLLPLLFLLQCRDVIFFFLSSSLILLLLTFFYFLFFSASSLFFLFFLLLLQCRDRRLCKIPAFLGYCAV